ncbi:ABC transporter substrate-binding protein [Bordetella genomosp. 7]|uniref:ABC transporter substrate-binding protein n=1 Tax=Bordetella genomosp. 7 TaxID=1416805 RepID=UPI00113FFA92|nr:ABC transporter substrate-binding protein [Bordetella genomosp. 7]
MLNRREFNLRATAILAGATVPGFVRAQGGGSRAAALRLVWPYDTSSLDATGIGVQRSTWAVSVHIYDRLVSYAVNDLGNGTGEYDPARIEPELAERWTVSDDGKTITFHLRPGATFHDGSPVTAEDVRWSIARALAMPAATASMRVGGLTSADQLSVLDTHTLQVKLPAPSRYAVAVFTIPFAAIINKKLATAHSTEQDPWASNWLKTNPAGGGAFRVGSFRPDQVMLVRNDKWVSGPLPASPQVIFQTVPEATLRTALVERNSADVAVEIPPADYQAVIDRKIAKALAIPMRNHMDFVALNSGAAPFNDVRVRQAIAYALPYEGLFKGVYRGRGVALYGGPAEVQGGVFPHPTPYATDIEKAKALLKAAGHEQGFSTSIAYSAGKAAYFDLASLAIKNSLEKIGIKVSIDRLPGAQFDERVARRDYGMLLENRVAWLSLPDYWMRAFYSGTTTSNLGNYHSEALQKMLQQLQGDATPEQYDAQTKEMIKLVTDEVPLIPIRQGAVEIVVGKNVTGYTYWFHGLPDARSIQHR